MALDDDADRDPFEDHEGEFLYDGTGSQHIDDNIYVFQDMERELETLVRKFQISPADLENLCKVVMTMSEMMDQARDELGKVSEQKSELEKLWKVEKHNWGVEKKKNVELDCRYEEERQKFEAERKNLETIKAQLQTKLNQTISQKAILEQEVQRLKSKSENDELMRKKLTEQYKSQIAEAKITSTRKQVHHNQVSSSPEPELARQHIRRTSSLLLQSPQPPDGKPPSASQQILLEGGSTPQEQAGTPEVEELHTAPAIGAEPHPPEPKSILTEMNDIMRPPSQPETAHEDETHNEYHSRELASSRPENTLGMSLQDEMELVKGNEAPSSTHHLDVLLKEKARWTEERTNLEMELLRTREEKEAMESQLAAQENLLASEKADADMLLKEKDHWEEERADLSREGQKTREEKEALESQNAQLQVEVQLLKESECALNKELEEMRQDRDQILENYVDQPYENYCITRKELLDLLKMHQTTQIALEKEKEEKERLQKLLEAKTPWYDRFRMKMKSAFAKKEKPQNMHYQPVKRSSRGEPVGTPKEPVGPPKEPVGTPKEPVGPPKEPVGQRPLHTVSLGATVQVKEWLAPQDSLVQWESLPVWVGQIPLGGIETEKIDCAAVGRTYLSEVVRTLISPRPRASVSSPSTTIVPLWTSEVWVATSVGSSAFIEILDVLKKHNRDSRRFLIKGARHVQCMQAVPGVVEVSQDYLETSLIASKYMEGTNRKSRPEDDPYTEVVAPYSKYTHPSESFEEDRTVPNITSSRTKTSPVVQKEWFKQEIKSSKPSAATATPECDLTSRTLDLPHSDADNIETSVMWVLTDDNCLCFYPASTPCYQCLNRVQLSYRAFCIAHVRGRVLLGHTDSLVTVYTKQENKNIWKVYAPDKLIQLPSCCFSDQLPDVRCITEVGDRVWIAAGMSMYIFEAEEMCREGCILMDGMTPEKIVCVGSCALVSTGGPHLMLYDATSTEQLRVIDISTISSILDQPSLVGSASPPPTIKSMTVDESNVYIGTSTGKVVAVSIQSLRPLKPKPEDPEEPDHDGRSPSSSSDLVLSLHSHHIDEVTSLMYVPLPMSGGPPLAQGAGGINRPALSSKSLVVSAGKGHTCHSEEEGVEEEPSAVVRERNEPFQLLVWGHPC